MAPSYRKATPLHRLCGVGRHACPPVSMVCAQARPWASTSILPYAGPLGEVRVWQRQSLAPGDKHVFPAVVSERLAGEAAVERLHLKSCDVYEPQPLVLGCPP